MQDQERDRSVLLGTYLDHVREAVRRAVALAPEVHSDDLGEAVTRLIHWAETRHAAARKASLDTSPGLYEWEGVEFALRALFAWGGKVRCLMGG